MATDRLQLYNGALLLCGDLRLSSLSEVREPRYLLDLVWNDGGINFCLEQAQWHFAMRTSLFEYDTNITTQFGFSRGFTKPTDWRITSGIFQDEFMTTPLIDYGDEAGVWYANMDEIYVRYVSNDVAYGLDLSKWPATFTEYVKAYFASKVIHKISKSEPRIQYLLGPLGRPDRGLLHQALLTARNRASMALPMTFPTRGSWALSRHAGMRRPFIDGGNTTRLIG